MCKILDFYRYSSFFDFVIFPEILSENIIKIIFYKGNIIVKVVPFPSSDSKVMSPLKCALMVE